MFDLTDDIAVVIGGTGVLGGAIAGGLAQAGARVAVLGRNEERGEARARDITSAGGQASFFHCDATDREVLAQAREQIEAQYGAPTVLVNAAGGNMPAATITDQLSFEGIALKDWHECFDLNLVGGALLPCQEFGSAMVARGRGSIIHMTSAGSNLPISRVVAYSAAKAGVLNLTRFLAREWATRGVRVNSITPGFFPGEQNRRLLFQEDGTPTERGQQILGHTPMDRFGEPEEVIGAAVFLASQKASGFVTGAEIVVDGGFLATTI